jgi:molybdopterin-guanine dinucleotide biosynthesis protein A
MTSKRCSNPDVSALILAGGRATRMGGVDKRSLIVDGATIFDRQCAVLSERVAEIIVSSPHAVPGFRAVADAVPGQGPLAGIAAGLAASTTPWLLVVAGDMPYLTGALIDRLLAARAPDLDAVGIRVDGLPVPLLGVLRVAAAAPSVARRLAAGHLKATALLSDGELGVAWIDDPEVAALHNVNTPEDLDHH